MNEHETALKLYEAARAELVARMGQLDTVLLSYVGAIAAIGGIVIADPSKVLVLLVAPPLALTAALMTRQHSSVIGALSCYCVKELGPFLHGSSLRQWDGSNAISHCQHLLVNLRAYTQLLLILVPSILSLVTLHGKALSGDWWHISGWWIGVSAIAGSAANLLVLKQYREAIFRQIYELPSA